MKTTKSYYIRMMDQPNVAHASGSRLSFMEENYKPIYTEKGVCVSPELLAQEWFKTQNLRPDTLIEIYDLTGRSQGFYCSSAHVRPTMEGQIEFDVNFKYTYPDFKVNPKYVTNILGSNIGLVPTAYGWMLEFDERFFVRRRIFGTGVITLERFNRLCTSMLTHLLIRTEDDA